MTQDNSNAWKCSHPGCTQENPYCRSSIGQPANPDEKFTFTKVPGSELWLCQNMIGALEVQRSLQEDESDSLELALSDQEEELTPGIISDRMKEYIAGQDLAMKVMGTFLFREAILKPRLRNNPELLAKYNLAEPDVRKSIALLFGTTGSGKTLTIELAERLFDIPVSLYGGIKNVTSGAWVGTKIEQVFMHMVNDVVAYYQKKGEPMSAQDVVNGINAGEISPILALDEIDKIALKSNKGGNNVSAAQGEDQQSMLLTYLEDASVDLGKLGSLRTRNIVFVMMGAFSTPNKDGKTLTQVIEPNTAGVEFHDAEKADVDDKNLNQIYARAQPKHFNGWFMDQFVGRIAYMVPFMTLDMATLRAILSEYKGNPVSEMLAEIDLMGGELVFEDEALNLIAQKAHESHSGARALVRVLDNAMSQAVHYAPDKIKEGFSEIFISREMVENEGAIIEEGENATFRKPDMPEPMEQAHGYPLLPAPEDDVEEGVDLSDDIDLGDDPDDPDND